MDLSKSSTAYVERLIEQDGKPKILLLDTDTTAILSLATSQSALLKNDVFLIDKVANPSRQKLRHLDCTVFVRPSSESIQAIIDELRVPRYGKYTLVFTNVVRKSQLERLAEADDHEVVSRVQEMFLDWKKINNDLFSCGVPDVWQSLSTWSTDSLEDSVNSVFAVLGSLRLGHPSIRFESNSAVGRKFASQLDAHLTQHEGALPKSSTRNTVVLVLDRLNDPVTPLISHWTYQAMVDEILGIANNRVDLSHAADVPQSHREIVLSQDQDTFFSDTMYLNFGDLGAAVRDYVQHYSKRTKSSQQLESVADIKKFVDGLPEFKKMQSNTTKHVSLVGELSRLVDHDHLLAISEVEQSLACNENHAQDLQSIKDFIASPDVSIYLKYRLTALYGLRYRNNPNAVTEQLLQALKANNNVYEAEELEQAVRNLLGAFSSSRYPQEDLFKQGSIFMRAQQGLKGLRGVENVYTQHKALLDGILAQQLKNKLPREKYPYVSRSTDTEPTNIVVFYVGGATFEEARIVGEFNREGSKQSIMLGGTDIVNPNKFLTALSKAQASGR